MSRQNRKPKRKVSLSSLKQPRGIEKAATILQQQVAWHIRIIDKDGPFGWENVGIKKLWEIRAKLGELEKKTWGELIGRKHHPISKAKLSKAAKDRLDEIKQNDVDNLFSLHLSSKERVWGIKDRNCLRLLWWDPEHKVYPVPKKHT